MDAAFHYLRALTFVNRTDGFTPITPLQMLSLLLMQWTKAKISNAPGLTVIPKGNHAA
jgi:hypothetical protein